MIRKDKPEEVKQWFEDTIRGLWPIAMGSLSLRKSPCIREHCRACESGEGHSSYALYGRKGKQRFSIYVPDELAPDLERAIRNGRHLQEVMMEAGRRYALALSERRSARRLNRGAVSASPEVQDASRKSSSMVQPTELIPKPEAEKRSVCRPYPARGRRARQRQPLSAGKWVTIQFESHRVELAFIYEMEHDLRIGIFTIRRRRSCSIRSANERRRRSCIRRTTSSFTRTRPDGKRASTSVSWRN